MDARLRRAQPVGKPFFRGVPAAAFVPTGQPENSPAIYGWVSRQTKLKIPRGTAEKWMAARKNLSSRDGNLESADDESQP